MKSFSKETFSKIYQFLGPQVFRLFSFGTAVGLALSAVELSFAYALQAFLVALGVSQAQAIKIPRWFPSDGLVKVLCVIVVVACVRGVLIWAQTYMQYTAAERFKYKQRTRLLTWLFHSRSASSTEMTNLFGEWANNASFGVMTVQLAIVQLTSSLFIGLALLWMAPVVSLVSALALVVIYFPVRFVSRRDRNEGTQLSEEWSKTNNRLLMSIKNLLLIRIYSREKSEEDLANKSLSGYLSHVITHNKLMASLLVAPQIIGILLVCIITFMAKKENQLEGGALISYFYLFVRLLQNMSSGLTAISNVSFYWPQLSGMAKWWSTHSHDSFKIKNDKKIVPKEIAFEPHSLSWNVEKLSFCYPSASTSILSSLNLKIDFGSNLVITGSSGVGKSTLLNLLLGELDPTEGSVKVSSGDQIYNLSEVKGKVLGKIGYVGAESFLIEGTIYDNLIYGLSQKPAEDDIKKSLQISECSFVYDMKDGLNHLLTEQGQGLSAGQKQRLSLARALLRKPLALILDEATANLDHETEVRLVQTLKSLKGQMTIIAVTHRQELLKIADQTLKL